MHTRDHTTTAITQAHPEVGFLKKYVFSIDHKIIGIQFLFLGLMFMVVGGLLAMLIRWQLAWPDEMAQWHGAPDPDPGQDAVGEGRRRTRSWGDHRRRRGEQTVTVRQRRHRRRSRPGDAATIKSASGRTCRRRSCAVKTTPRRSTLPTRPGRGKVGRHGNGKQAGSMPPDFYTMVFTMHASIMIFFVIIPLLVGTFGNYLIPLKIGAPDMAFPFLNGLAFWSAVPAGAILIASFFMPSGAAQAGWTSYPPLSWIVSHGSRRSLGTPSVASVRTPADPGRVGGGFPADRQADR